MTLQRGTLDNWQTCAFVQQKSGLGIGRAPAVVCQARTNIPFAAHHLHRPLISPVLAVLLRVPYNKTLGLAKRRCAIMLYHEDTWLALFVQAPSIGLEDSALHRSCFVK
eukprot:jgi/Botrbrau1/18110/Bobra.0486s0002.1